jgi:hypothetical protein
MNDIPDPFKNYTMKGNAQTPATQAPTVQVDPSDLIAVKAMVWDKLVAIAAVMPANEKGLPILREIMDRIDGKAVAKQETKILAAVKHNIDNMPGDIFLTAIDRVLRK